MDILSELSAHTEIEHSRFVITEILQGNKDKSDVPECGYFPNQSPHILCALQNITKAKKELRKKTSRRDKLQIETATLEVRKFIVTQDRDTQIEILKMLQ